MSCLRIARVAGIVLTLASAGVAAQSAGDFKPRRAAAAVAESASTAPRPADDGLYRDLGGQPAIEALVADFVSRAVADPRLHPFFEKTDQKNLRDHLVEQICVVAGGPCEYTGALMKKAHADFAIHMSDFNVLVEVLQDSMQAQGIAFPIQNRLLARLAPMHREIVNTP